MPDLVLYLADLAAISLLVFGVYFPRHHRRDLVVAFLGRQRRRARRVGGVVGQRASAPASASVCSACCRSSGCARAELDQHEVAYYFSALALGLLGGLSTDSVRSPLVLMAFDRRARCGSLATRALTPATVSS